MRRRFTRARGVQLAALFAAGSLMLAGCGSDKGQNSSGPQTLTWASTGGQFQDNEIEALQKPFTEKTGTKFKNVSPADPAQVRAMVESGRPVWDLANMSWIYAGAYCDKFYEKLDHRDLDRSLFPEGTTGDCFVPTYRFANVFAYNADLYKGEQPDNIKDFFDTKRFPGKRIVFDYPKNGLLESALVADGVDPKDLYPLDVERALRKLDTIKDQLVFAPSYGAVQQMLVDKQAAMVITVTARAIATAESGANLKAVWDFNTTDIGALVIPKGTPRADLAQDAIAFAIEPEQAKAYAALTGTAPARTDVDIESIDYSDVQKSFNAFLPDRGRLAEQDKKWWIENTDKVLERWTEWKIG
ncbi:extracellular solute-binding protein [Streptomyces tagetis]|uniref:Extracellular solute-binding protein n=1 Tax=Streptomyces tagetis TaxID=2820809 RepID=A0A941AXS5_9ACTN|nr:extracellular solute-binding protein [Streptomyces sp. RG38]MBQ0826539.1 extracellular solute-binding protein [Streptomyces sp. RG38]